MSQSLYEGMFLLTQPAAGNLGDAVEHVKSLLDRAEADVLGLYKWDERKLAYTIKGQRRGVYLLTYFKIDGEKIQGLDRDCNLSEQVLRAMFVRTDHLGETEINEFIKNVEASLDPKILANKAVNTDPTVEPTGTPKTEEAPAEAKTDEAKPAEAKTEDAPAEATSDDAPAAEEVKADA